MSEKPIANLGDADPIENGGFFVYVDADGGARVEVLEEPCDDARKACVCDDEPYGPQGAAEQCEAAVQSSLRIDREYNVPTLESWAEEAHIRAEFASRIRADARAAADHAEWVAHVATHERYTVYRFDLERFDSVEAIRSEWFGDVDSLRSVAETCDVREEDTDETGSEILIRWLMSEDPLQRAEAYRCMIANWGLASFDSYPITLTRAEVEARYPNV